MFILRAHVQYTTIHIELMCFKNGRIAVYRTVPGVCVGVASAFVLDP